MNVWSRYPNDETNNYILEKKDEKWTGFSTILRANDPYKRKKTRSSILLFAWSGTNVI